MMSPLVERPPIPRDPIAVERKRVKHNTYAPLDPTDWPFRQNSHCDREPCALCGDFTRGVNGWEIRQAGIWVRICLRCATPCRLSPTSHLNRCETPPRHSDELAISPRPGHS